MVPASQRFLQRRQHPTVRPHLPKPGAGFSERPLTKTFLDWLQPYTREPAPKPLRPGQKVPLIVSSRGAIGHPGVYTQRHLLAVPVHLRRDPNDTSTTSDPTSCGLG